MSSDHSFPAAVLAIDIVLALPVVYITLKHGIRHAAIIGWAYLFVFLTLRIVSSAMQLKDSTNPSASLVASIGLSPLLLSAVGILHESRGYSIENRRRSVDTIWVLLLHVVISTAVALTGVGASGMSKADITEDVRNKDKKLVIVGMVLLLLSWVCISMVTAASFLARPRTTSSGSTDQKQGKWLLYAVALAIPFLGIRIITSLVYFSTQNQSLSPVTGDIGYKVGLGFIEELIVTVAFVFAGVATRNVGRDRSNTRVRSEERRWTK
ncbi:hypothetical protein BKA67DRAFT_533583 [Truncatella angustata]|uniref:DUF7702 domain-containing protein n=1 Tax=Truncatella angustata TaxID=152316 RepID=A0A9P9A2Z6_9PEZI|nr:uncharacterized protein BKA67DRAFT_533583 [Truncatella angustata]KAH6658430.1 hypothetical protein BKA67DRAFT_533583 [Truncatella angustata]KAH8201607.1 hypothetical protein TruAng_004213 [Truncatella angustata]